MCSSHGNTKTSFPRKSWHPYVRLFQIRYLWNFSLFVVQNGVSFFEIIIKLFLLSFKVHWSWKTKNIDYRTSFWQNWWMKQNLKITILLPLLPSIKQMFHSLSIANGCGDVRLQSLENGFLKIVIWYDK